MEYTKDVIFNIRYKGKKEKWTSKLQKILKENKFIISLMGLLTILTILDITLVSSFISILTTI